MARKAAEPPPEAPESQSRQRLSDLDALEHDLGVAEQRLDAELGKKQLALSTEHDRPADDEDAGEEKEDAPNKASEQRTEPPGAEAPRQSRPPRWKEAELATPCDMACRALASMKR